MTLRPSPRSCEPYRPVVVALVGARFAASLHLANYGRAGGPPVVVRGVASRDPSTAKAFAERHGLAVAYETFEAVLADEQVEIVDLCVPNRLHEPLAIEALSAGKHVVVEKPLTAYCGPAGSEGKCGLFYEDAERMYEQALASADRMLQAERDSGRRILYAENWIYAPAIQKANRLLARADTTIFRIVGEESHSGTHSEYSKQWQYAGGGSLFNKGCHPLAAALYLKAEEGRRRTGQPVRPKAVTARVGRLTHIASFQAEPTKYVKTGWQNAEDWGSMLVEFEDGSVAQITASDTVLGGICNTLTIYASKATIHAAMIPNTCLTAYTPDGANFGDEYIREKVETTSGWQSVSPDEDWMNGFCHELRDFCEAVRHDRAPLSDGWLGREVVRVGYSAYVAAQTGKTFELPE